MSSASSLDQVTNVERFGFSASSCDLRAKLPLRMDTYELYAQNTLHKTDSSVLNALRILMLLSPIRMLRFAGNMRNEPQQITAFVQDGHGMTVHGYGCLHLCEKTLTREHSLRICYAAGSPSFDHHTWLRNHFSGGRRLWKNSMDTLSYLMLLDSSPKHRDSCILGPLEITASGRRGEGDSKFLNFCPKNKLSIFKYRAPGGNKRHADAPTCFFLLNLHFNSFLVISKLD